MHSPPPHRQQLLCESRLCKFEENPLKRFCISWETALPRGSLRIMLIYSWTLLLNFSLLMSQWRTSNLDRLILLTTQQKKAVIRVLFKITESSRDEYQQMLSQVRLKRKFSTDDVLCTRESRVRAQWSFPVSLGPHVEYYGISHEQPKNIKFKFEPLKLITIFTN